MFSWAGAYIGAFLGGGSGAARFRDPRSASIYGDTVRTPFVEGGGQVGYNVQFPASRYVAGFEADGGAIGLGGTNTCLAYSSFAVPDNCRVSGAAMATGTGRAGYAFGADGRTLVYVKGGVAALFEKRDITANHTFFFGNPSTVLEDRPQLGFTVGAGLEQALSNALSLKIEYDFADFGAREIGTPQSAALVAGSYATVAPGTTSARQSLHELKVGLNYHFDAASGGSRFLPDGFAGTLASNVLASPHGLDHGYRIETGARYWYSFGRFQKDLGLSGQPTSVLISRLTYADESSSGELYGRIDTPARVFVKGFVGAGGEMTGQHNDEDFRVVPANVPVPYSNTVSGQTGTLDYATVDLGYSVLETASTKVGGFVGYNYYKDSKDGLGCRQVAATAGADCMGAAARPTSILGITEDDRYNALRLGVNGDMWIDRLRLQADAAYLPFVGFQGVDDHLFRNNEPSHFSPEFGHGQGVQLELIASYDLTPNLSLGVGGRYWGTWIPDARTNSFSTGIIASLPVHTERFGLMVQGAYRFSTSGSDPIVSKY